MKLLLTLSLSLFVTSSAAAAGVAPRTISSHLISPRSPAHYFVVAPRYFATVASGLTERIIVPFSGRLVDVILHQQAAGSGGTSYTLDLQNEASTSLFSTLPVATQASGNSTRTDTKGEIALPTGWTRGVIKVDGTATLTKGARVTLHTIETGSYSTHATILVTLVFEPLE